MNDTYKNNNDLPLVTILIPAYNASPYISESLESALGQTYEALEIMVVDDGSTDNTEELVREFGDKVVYLKKENGGPSSARNYGIARAKGEYIAFLDADDLWYPEKIAIQIEAFQNEPELGMTYCNMQPINKEDVLTYVKPYPEAVSQRFSGDVFYKLFMFNFIPTPTVMVKKEVFEKAGLFPEHLRFSEDYHMWLRICAYYKARHIDQVLAYRRIHQGQASNDLDELYKGELRVIRDIIENLRDSKPNLIDYQQDRMFSLAYDYGIYTLKGGNFKKARHLFIEALKNDPFALQVFFYLLCTYLSNGTFQFIRRVKSFLLPKFPPPAKEI